MVAWAWQEEYTTYPVLSAISRGLKQFTACIWPTNSPLGCIYSTCKINISLYYMGAIVDRCFTCQCFLLGTAAEDLDGTDTVLSLAPWVVCKWKLASNGGFVLSLMKWEQGRILSGLLCTRSSSLLWRMSWPRIKHWVHDQPDLSEAEVQYVSGRIRCVAKSQERSRKVERV